MDLQNIDYGKIIGLDAAIATNHHHSTKATHDTLRNISSNKNQSLTKMIADAERKRELLQQLQNSTSVEDQTKLETIHWKDTFQEANGIRQKDNVQKLKQKQKRVIAKKRKSQKQWSSRLEQIHTASMERQQIRNHNLQSRMVGGSIGANLSKKEMKQTNGTKTTMKATTTTNGTKTPSNPNHATSTTTSISTTSRRPGFEGRKNHFLNRNSSTSNTTTVRRSNTQPSK
jgi:hypothetical protein